MTLTAQLDAALSEAIALDAPLDARMKVIRDAVRQLSPEFAVAVDRLVERLSAVEAGAHAPQPGDRLPAFLLPDADGKLVSLQDLLARGPLVVAFHRGFWCPYCRLHAVALGEVRRHVEAAGAHIVAIAPDRRRFNAQLSEQGGGDIPVLSDVDNAYALSINLAIWVGEEMQAMMDGGGFRLPETQGNDAWLLPIPATFVLARDGTIMERHIDPDYRRRMDINLLLNAVRRVRQAA
jgi:peroxiredoxin